MSGPEMGRFLGTNAGARPLAFQQWHRFKEAFPPELVQRAIRESDSPVRTCLDPFGGSGTTALAAQFLGISSTTIEVNPFLVDVIRAKLGRYDPDQLSRTCASVRRWATRSDLDPREFFSQAPKTFIEPGLDERWLFDRRVASLLGCATGSDRPRPRSIGTASVPGCLGGLLVDVSNVVVSGKGRRYRRDWRNKPIAAETVDRLFFERAVTAIADVHRFGNRPTPRARVIQGDARRMPTRAASHDIAVFSPPYPIRSTTQTFITSSCGCLAIWRTAQITAPCVGQRWRHTCSSTGITQRRLPAPRYSDGRCANSTWYGTFCGIPGSRE